MRRGRGFTLIEIIIALTVFSMLMGVITNAITLARKLNVQDDTTGDGLLEQYLTRLTIEEDMRNFVSPVAGSDEAAFERDVVGNDETLTFYTVTQRPMTIRGIYKVEFRAEKGKLIRALSSGQGTASLDEESTLEFLDGVKELAFKFSDFPDAEAATSDWPHQNRLPRYIVVCVLLDSSDNDGSGATETVEWIFSLGQVS